MEKCWTTYLLTCADGTLYCGVTNGLRKRVLTHNMGKGAKYTRSRLPVTFLFGRCHLTKSQAMKLEYQVKQQPKSKKLEFLKNAPVAQLDLERGATNAEVGDSNSSGCAKFPLFEIVSNPTFDVPEIRERMQQRRHVYVRMETERPLPGL